MKEGWVIKKIKDICMKASSNVAQKDLGDNNGDYPIYGASGFIKNIDFYHYDKPYIGIVKDGSGVGRVNIYPAYSALLGTLQYILPKNGYDLRFVSYALQSLDLSKYKVGAAIPHIYFRDYGETKLCVPPLPEQERIVSILDAEFAKIDAVKAGAEKSLQHAKDLFQAALKKELTPKEGWETKKLKEVAEICLGLTHTPQYVEKGVPFVSVKDISGGVLDLSKTKKISKEEFENFPYGAKPNKGDVLFCRVGTLGKPLVLALEEPFGIFVSVGFLRPNRNIIHPEILRFWMLSSMFDSQVNANVVGSTLKNLNTGWLKNFIVSIPPMIEQVTVIDNLFRIEKNCKTLQANYERTIALCDDMKQALLRKAFNGEL